MKKLLSLIFLAALLQSVNAQTIAPFKAGDRVCFVGNSITDGGHYHSDILLYYMTRFPDMPIRVYNCGIGGDKSPEVAGRLQHDVLDRKPTVVAITYGMNDAGMFELNSDTAEVFKQHSYEIATKMTYKMEDLLKAQGGLRVVEVGSSPYDEVSKMDHFIFKDKNIGIQRIVELQKKVAERNNWEFIDFNAPMLAINEEWQKNDSTFSIIGQDGVHPDNDGHMYMAYLWLKAQGMEGRNVADVSLNAKSGNILSLENCTISNLNAAPESVSFTYLSRSLPFPLDTDVRGDGYFKRRACDFERFVPDFQEKFNSERLQVKDLKKGRYQLAIDEVVIDTLDAAKLAEGINLATYKNTPQYQQAVRVLLMNEDRWTMERRLRDWAWVKYDYFEKNGVYDLTSPEAERIFERDKQGNWWLTSRTGIYLNMRNKGVEDACYDYLETVTAGAYEVARPVERKVTITPVK